MSEPFISLAAGEISRSLSLVSFSRPSKKPEPTRLGKYGVAEPDVTLRPGGESASLDACKSRFVVPRAFVWDERAEQTSATREFGMYELCGYEHQDHLLCSRVER